MKRKLLLCAFFLICPSLVFGACRDHELDLVFDGCKTPPIGLKLRFLPEDARVKPLSEGERLTVTGTYSSGDRYGVEGLALRRGEIVSGRFQSWDGVFLIYANGLGELQTSRNLKIGPHKFNLKNQDERKRFLEIAKSRRLSLIQGHMLIIDGRVDVANRDDAPLFKRRLLLEGWDGSLSIFDTGEITMTLHDVANYVQARMYPRYAFNLDMGSYDYCKFERGSELENCGFLKESSIEGKLTNLIEFTFAPDNEGQDQENAASKAQ